MVTLRVIQTHVIDTKHTTLFTLKIIFYKDGKEFKCESKNCKFSGIRHNYLATVCNRPCKSLLTTVLGHRLLVLWWIYPNDRLKLDIIRECGVYLLRRFRAARSRDCKPYTPYTQHTLSSNLSLRDNSRK